jgi:predicted AAA+ superfamily ATPase
LPTAGWLAQNQKLDLPAQNLKSLYTQIWQGSFPRYLASRHKDRDLFYRSYLQTYVQRDVRDFYQVSDEGAFHHFLRAVAARTGSLLNYADLARDVGKDAKTLRQWLSLLERSGLVFLLPPYFNNQSKRLTQSPKIYFLDTGLACFLLDWDSPKTLEAGALTGAILETHAFIEILKSYWHNGKNPSIYFYRDKDLREVDFLIESENMLYPIEIKKTATPSLVDLKNFGALQNLGKPIGPGAVLCMRSESIPIEKNVTAIPVWRV